MLATSPSRPSDLLALVREVELRRVDARAHVYLDYTGAALYPESLLRQHFAQLRNRTLGNPHSTNPSAHAATEDIAAAKLRVLRYFDADPADYDVGFTANASAALRLVGESFPWRAQSRFALTADNHNSVNGIREFARQRGARTRYIALGDELRIADLDLPHASGHPSLFAFPAQSNFSGVRHPLSWIGQARSLGYRVLLDAAAYVPTAPLSLRAAPADFVAISFYKMFGYPSGIGALIAQRAAMRELVRPWFAGGTVDFVSVSADAHCLKPDMEAFEDGTINFLAASAVSVGLGFLEQIGIERVSAHVAMLTRRLLFHMENLGHSNGGNLVRVYGPHTTEARGGTVAFNVVDRNGAIVDCEAVVRSAAESGISLRSGCFCNPGAAEAALGYSFQELEHKRPGAVRASLGYGSNQNDVDALVRFLESYRS